ncbi:MAG: hypothetical protein HC853_14660 [Anaerolineae bacterium]|nr:hypothetical protein [Anaerolineae bacterium]
MLLRIISFSNKMMIQIQTTTQNILMHPAPALVCQLKDEFEQACQFLWRCVQHANVAQFFRAQFPVEWRTSQVSPRMTDDYLQPREQELMRHLSQYLPVNEYLFELFEGPPPGIPVCQYTLDVGDLEANDLPAHRPSLVLLTYLTQQDTSPDCLDHMTKQGWLSAEPARVVGDFFDLGRFEARCHEKAGRNDVHSEERTLWLQLPMALRAAGMNTGNMFFDISREYQGEFDDWAWTWGWTERAFEMLHRAADEANQILRNTHSDHGLARRGKAYLARCAVDLGSMLVWTARKGRWK